MSFGRALRGLSFIELETAAGELLQELAGESKRAESARLENKEDYTADDRRKSFDTPGGEQILRQPEADSSTEARTAEAAADREEMKALVRTLREISDDKGAYLGAVKIADAAEGGFATESGGIGAEIVSAGVQRLEMRSVSDFFKRDSRRYDGGFIRY